MPSPRRQCQPRGAPSGAEEEEAGPGPSLTRPPPSAVARVGADGGSYQPAHEFIRLLHVCSQERRSQVGNEAAGGRGWLGGASVEQVEQVGGQGRGPQASELQRDVYTHQTL